MKKGLATRTAIVNEALKQASQLGLEGVSLGPLADSLQLSKSGLFAHFKSKEALQIEVLAAAIDQFKAEVILPGARLEKAEEKLVQFFTRWLTWIRGQANRSGCIFMTLAQEFDHRPGAVREMLVASQKEMRTYLASIFKQGVAEGRFKSDLDAGQCVFELYGLALSYQQGANLLNDPKARRRALSGLERLLDSIAASPGKKKA